MSFHNRENSQVRRPLLAAIILVSSACAATAADNYTKLPPGPGRDVEVRVCSQCHSPELPATQRHDKAGWNDLVNEMQSNGASATDAEFAEIVNYLATAFPQK